MLEDHLLNKKQASTYNRKYKCTRGSIFKIKSKQVLYRVQVLKDQVIQHAQMNHAQQDHACVLKT